MMHSHYEVLGVPLDASDEDIRKAYRRLALLHHPDKCGGDDTLFKKINEAYQILTDPAKRAAYDAYSQHAFPGMTDPLAFKRFISMIISFLYRKQEPAKKSLVLDVEVGIEELYHAKIKKIVVKVSRDGVFKSVPLYLSLLNYENEYVFKNMGDEKENDIVVKLKVAEHPVFKIDNIITKYDIYIERNISLYEYYFGARFDIEFLDKKKLTIEKAGFSAGNMVHVVKGMGLPYSIDGNELMRGDLLVFFKLVLPETGPKKLRRVLKKYFSYKNV